MKQTDEDERCAWCDEPLDLGDPLAVDSGYCSQECHLASMEDSLAFDEEDEDE